MSLARVHAVMAAGVEHPRLLERWMSEPALLRELGVDPEGFDLAALGKFAGLGVKVRHNPLRPMFPLSFRLMGVAAVEIDLFAAYALLRSREGRGFDADMGQRARDLVAFVGAWHDPADRAHALLWDALRYEAAMSWLRDDAETPADAGAAARVPRIRGRILLHALGSDPRLLAEALHASAPDLGRVPQEPQEFCFWRAPDGACSAVAVDALGHHLLSRIDGRRSARALARELGGGDAVAAVGIALRTLADIGIVAMPGARRRPAAPACA